MKFTSLLRHSVICLFFLFSLTTFCYAQAGNISGKIFGSKNDALPGAVAELRLIKDSTLSKAAVTDPNGLFTLENVKAGEYYIKTSYIGYEPFFTKRIKHDGTSDQRIENISMNETGITLKAAEISAFRPLVEVKADKTVFNVETSINSTGSTAYELLQKAPGVVVDNNDNITLKGRGGVMVQIDGRPARLSETELADYLKNVQSTDVESIELISNPSSKYDAEGTAGIINIKMKKNKNYGTNGSVTLGYAYGKYSKYNSAISLNSRSRKINFYSNYSNNFGDRFNEFNLYREQNPYIFTQSAIGKRSGLSHNFKAGADYTLNTKNSIGLMVNGNISDNDGKQTNRNYIKDYNTGIIDSVLKSDQTFEFKSTNINVNLNHQFKDTMGHELTTDLDFGYYDGERNTYIPSEYVLPDLTTPLSSTYNRNITPTEIKIITLKSDYSQRWLKGKISGGYKASMVNTDNTFNFININDGTDQLDTARSNNFEYEENVYALYINYQRNIGKRFDVQVGVRMEHTASTGTLDYTTAAPDSVVERDYTDLFPSAGLTFNLNKDHSLALVYSSRIDRPNYQELNPFEWKLDELSFRRGNPFLNPQYSDKIELSHTYKYTTTVSIGYSHTDDFFAQIADTFPGGKSVLTPRNLATEDVINFNVSSSQQPVKWYSFYINAGVYNQRYDADFGEGKTINTSFTVFNMYAQNTFKLPKGFTLELSGWYNSGGVWGGSYKSDGNGSVDIGLQKRLFKDKATLKLSLTDVFETAPWSSTNTYAGIVARANGNWESRQFRASFSYRFGNNQMRGIRQRSSGSDSELKRISGDN